MIRKRYREETAGVDSIKLANLLMQFAGGGEDARRRSTTPGRVFECMTCSRQLQALGGHRASHRKPKVSVDHDRAQETSMKPRVHECSICGLQFAMGQALGGHMRRYRASAEGLICHGFAEKKPSNGGRVLLDLNMPPLGRGRGEQDIGIYSWPWTWLS